MSIPKLAKAANGYFYAVWSDAGRSRRKSMGTQDPAVATERFGAWLLIKDDSPEARATITVADAWAVYMRMHGDAVVCPSALEKSWMNLGAHFGERPVSSIKQADVDAFVALRVAGKLGRPVKPQTCRRELKHLQAALRFCAKPSVALYTVADVPNFDAPPAGPPRDRWLTSDEIARLFAAAEAARPGSTLTAVEIFMHIALRTAARQTAIQELTWDRVNFDDGLIDFNVPGRKVTKKRRAVVPMADKLRTVLLRAKAENTEKRATVVPRRHRSALWCDIQAVASAAFGLRGKSKKSATSVSPHVFRHTAATHMAKAGVPLWDIANVLGNTTAMVERVYAKRIPGQPARTVNFIDTGE